MPAWTPGASGNKRGRPPKGRALTEILERAGNLTVVRGDKKAAKKRILADMLWEAAMTGKVLFGPPEKPDECTVRELDVGEWFDVAKFIYAHIDGPPKAGLLDDLPEDTSVSINFVRVEGRQPSQQPTEASDDPA